jgi:hypothetical protein
MILEELVAAETLLVIPCSKGKRSGGEPSARKLSPWPPDLLTARQPNLETAKADERQLLPAWLRYTGGFYATAGSELRDAVARDTPLLILSGGYGVLHAEEPIGDYNKILRLTDWPGGLLEDLLIREAGRRNVSSVVAFAASSSDYAKLIRRTQWKEVGIGAFLVTIKNAGMGASGKVPRRLGQAFACFWRGRPAEMYPEGTTVEILG